MEIRNKTLADRAIPQPEGDDIEVPAGGTAEVPDDQGASLCEQVDVWEPAKRKKVSDAPAPAEQPATGEEG